MEYVPIQSYYKSTLAQFYSNEGEVIWTVFTLMFHIKKSGCMAELVKEGYEPYSRGFTPAQVKLIFEYIHTPLLNDANRKLLKLINHEKD